jgi:hypothetical protein
MADPLGSSYPTLPLLYCDHCTFDIPMLSAMESDLC